MENLNSEKVQKYFKDQTNFTGNYMKNLKYTDEIITN